MPPEADPNPCLDEQALVAYVGGSMGADARVRADAHLDVCAECLAVLAALGRAEAEADDDASSERAAPERYRVLEEIAAGGMGQVFVAYDTVLRRKVALKAVREGASASTLAQRFEREMALTAQLQHPAIVPIYDAGHFPDGTRFFAMLLVDGEELEQRLDGSTSMAERMTLVTVVRRACEAVAYAHQQGVVHRDLKPKNILIGPLGETVVVDWGLAKRLDADDDTVDAQAPAAPGATVPGSIMGTPGYLAPEVQRGEPATPAADVYSLGVVLGQVLLGSADPARGADASALEGHAVPEDLRAVLGRALAPLRASRYRDASELAEDLQRFAAGQMVRARAYSWLALARRFVARHRVAVGLTSALAIALLGTATWSVRNIVEARDSAELARRQADEQRTAAQEQRAAAEGLLGYAVEDLSRELDRAGRIELLESVADQINAYYAQAPSAPQGREALVHAKALSVQARALVAKLDYPAAHALRLRAVERLAPLAEADDASRDAKLAYADELSLLSQSYLLIGEPARAREAGRRCEAWVSQQRGTEVDVRIELALASCHLRLGMVEFARGELAPAQASFARAHERLPTAAAGGDEVEAERLAQLGSLVDAWLGLTLLSGGDVREALPPFLRAQRALERLRSMRPHDIRLYDRLVEAEFNVAQCQLALDQPAAARQRLERSMPTTDLLITLEPTRLDRRVGKSQHLELLAEAQRHEGDLAAAIATIDANIELVAALAEQGPDNAFVRAQLAWLQVQRADAMRHAGRADEIDAGFEAAVEQLLALERSDPQALPGRVDHAVMTSGVVARARGQLPRARARLDDAQRRLERRLESDRSEPNRLAAAEALMWRAELAHQQGDDALARAHLRRALELATTPPPAYPTAITRALLERLRRRSDQLGVGLDAR